jgi:hypothetical protein
VISTSTDVRGLLFSCRARQGDTLVLEFSSKAEYEKTVEVAARNIAAMQK